MNLPALQVIAFVHTPLTQKFGIPRQSNLSALPGEIRFTPPFRNPDALRGIEAFSHLWLLWLFSEHMTDSGTPPVFHPTVRPPRLGGNEKRGVFATRSPFRPNPIGLSSVKLEGIRKTDEGDLVLLVSGVDLLDGTPILDIKPYLSYTDSHPDAVCGFASEHLADRLPVSFPPVLLDRIPDPLRAPLLDVLANDPRPSYQNDPDRVYGFPYAGFEIKFRVTASGLSVTDVIPEGEE